MSRQKPAANKIAHQRTCDVCFRLLPEDKVDDEVADLSEATGIVPCYVGMVVSFCIDNDKCRAKAQQITESYRKWIGERQAEKPFRISRSTKQ